MSAEFAGAPTAPTVAEIKEEFMMTAVNFGDQKYSFTQPLRVVHAVVGDIHYYRCAALQAEAYDVVEEKALADFKEAVAFLHEFSKEKDSDLPPDGIAYRDLVKSLITTEASIA